MTVKREEGWNICPVNGHYRLGIPRSLSVTNFSLSKVSLFWLILEFRTVCPPATTSLLLILLVLRLYGTIALPLTRSTVALNVKIIKNRSRNSSVENGWNRNYSGKSAELLFLNRNLNYHTKGIKLKYVCALFMRCFAATMRHHAMCCFDCISFFLLGST